MVRHVGVNLSRVGNTLLPPKARTSAVVHGNADLRPGGRYEHPTSALERIRQSVKDPGRIDNATRHMGGGVPADARLGVGSSQRIELGGCNVGAMAFLREGGRKRTRYRRSSVLCDPICDQDFDPTHKVRTDLVRLTAFLPGGGHSIDQNIAPPLAAIGQ